MVKAKIAFITLRVYLKGKVEDISPPQFLAVSLQGKVIRGIIRINLKVTIALDSVDKGKTGVTCKSTGEMMGGLVGMVLMPMARSFAGKVHEGIEKRLRHLA